MWHELPQWADSGRSISYCSMPGLIRARKITRRIARSAPCRTASLDHLTLNCIKQHEAQTQVIAAWAIMACSWWMRPIGLTSRAVDICFSYSPFSRGHCLQWYPKASTDREKRQVFRPSIHSIFIPYGEHLPVFPAFLLVYTKGGTAAIHVSLRRASEASSEGSEFTSL